MVRHFTLLNARRFLLGLLLGLAIQGPAVGEEIRGTVKQVDLEKGVVFLKRLNQDREQELSLLNREVPVSNALGQPAKLTDLRPGHRLAVKTIDDFIVAVKFEGPTQWGVIQKIAPDTRLVHFEDAIEPHSVTLPAELRLLVDGRPGKFTDLKVGQPIRVLFTPDQKTVLDVTAGKGVANSDPYRHLLRRRIVLLEVDHAKRFLQTIAQPASEPLYAQSFSVASSVTIRLIHHYRLVQHARFQDLIGPLAAVLTLDLDDNNVVVAIDVDMHAYGRRKVVSVDPDRHTITVDMTTKVRRTLPLDPEVRVLLPAGEGKLADVKPGQVVDCALGFNREKVVVVYVWER